MRRPGRKVTAFAALVLLALIFRIGGAVASFDTPLVFDAKDFDRHARSIVTGHGYPDAVHVRGGPSALRPPAYPFVLALAYAVRGGSRPPAPASRYLPDQFPVPRAQVTAGRIEQALIGTAIVLLIGLIALQVWSSRVALWSLAIAACYPPLIALGFTLVSDPLFVMFELAAVAAALRARDPAARSLRWALAAGALGGLAWLTRSNGYTLLLPVALLVWTGRPRLRPSSLIAPVAVVAVAVAVVTPWTIRNAVTLHSFVLVSDNSGYTLAGTYNPTSAGDPNFRAGWRPAQEDPGNARLIAASTSELDEAQLLGRAARTYLAHHPFYALEAGWCNSLRLAFLGWASCGDSRAAAPLGYVVEDGLSRPLADGTIVSFWLVALLALGGAITRRARRAPPALWLVPVAVATVVFVLAANRFRAPLEPFLIMLAASALVSVVDSWRGWRKARDGAPHPAVPVSSAT